MANSTQSTQIVRFGDFALDVRTGELSSDGQHIILQEKPFQILTALLERPGEMVTREELIKRLWPAGTFVDFDLSLNKAVNRLREALDDSAEKPRFIETFPKRGYRFTASVTRNPAGVSGAASPASSTQVSNRPNGPGDENGAKADSPRWRVTLIAGLIAMAAVASYMAWRRHSPAPAAGRIMIAVLPFQNLTGDADEEYLTDGLTEETIARLGALQPERLGVIARTSIMGYKHGDKRLDQIGRELDVQYVVEGSVRRERDHLRITAQLIQVKDQSHLWAQEYDRSSHDIIALQDDVAAGVTQEIQSRWAIESRTHPSHHQPASPEAYEAYLRGRYSLNRRTEEGLHNALGYFHSATDLDPGYALAYEGLADCYVLMVVTYDIAPEATVQEARTAAKKAIELDSGLAEPHAVLALIAGNHDWNWEEAEREYKLALNADPSNATVHHWYSASLAARGRFEESRREIATARRLDPMSLPIRTAEGAEAYLARRYDDALSELGSVMEIDANYANAYLYRGLAYEQKGKWKEAVADLENSERLDNSLRSAAMLGQGYALAGDKTRARQILDGMQARAQREHVSPLYPAIVHIGLGDKDMAFSELQGAVEEHTTDLLAVKVGAFFDPLRSDQRFAALVRRVGLPMD